ncbi:MAG: hypothetical protein M1480_18175 [Bacteroidetes bacterium]|nr:hypothetical protein [Bacteroidota bacterium]
MGIEKQKKSILSSGINIYTIYSRPFDSPYHVIGFNLNSLKFLIRKLDLEIKYVRNFGRKFDFLSFTPNKKGFWISLFFLFPIEIIGNLIKRDVYIEAYLTK